VEFIGRRSVSLSVPKYSLPMPNNEQPEINVTIDGRLRLLSQLGAGIGEALIVLLVSKLSQEWQHPPVDILLLEEPELHIHSTLQRKLLDRLAAYGLQIVAATHSPTVVNWFARNGGRVFRTEFIEAQERITARQATGLTDLRDLIGSIGASPADVILADRVLLVEGSNDVPVFKAWLQKAPSYGGQNVAVLSVGGDDATSINFDPEQWKSLHPKIRAIIDSERKARDQEPHEKRLTLKARLQAARIGCHLTELRATESYFTSRALQLVYGDCSPRLDPFGDPNLADQGVKQFKKPRNGEVAQAMEWAELKNTDLGDQIEDFLKF
jgi:putative AbiEii toxin of type IV toxin-antitoxin system